MNNFQVFLGSFYVVIGTLFLLVPIIYLELRRPKDLIKAFLNLIIGFILIIKNGTLNDTFAVIFLLFTVLDVFYVSEMFLTRWNQLTDKEKKKLTTFLEFKNNFSKILESINLVFGNFTKPSNFFNFGSNNKNTTQKKWVRNDKNDNIKV